MTEVQPANQSTPSSGEPPEEFFNQVRDGLAHLYDLGYLQVHSLAPQGAAGGQAFKRQLMEMIESVNPGPAFYFRAPQARPYNMLLLHYVERVTIQKAARELGISERQAYRELREGELSITRLLWAQREAAARGEDAQPGDTSRALSPETTYLRDLMEGAAATVQRLASQAGIRLNLDLDASIPVHAADQAAVRQILVSVLSRIVQAAEGEVLVRSSQRQETTFLTYTFTRKSEVGDISMPVDSIIQQLLQQVDWTYQQKHAKEGEECIEFCLDSSAQVTILLIDDDQGFSGLLRRYLNGRPVRLIHAQSGMEGIETARSTKPALIILDVMMPGLDGWETLQRLQLDPETRGIPLVICSVFNDPELARSLGARQLLPKPVSQERFLDTLSEMGVRIG